uniref:site-specific DNA-methyltransferase (cytosine-N(4)-specific) n=1 Tax=Thermosphaera aggregans TaxID=54254 RepID=A0A7C2G0W4_9CREN
MILEYCLARLYGIYSYPARFTPKVFNYFFQKVNEKGLFFDPFAGFGSLSFACYLQCLDSISWDLNPMLQVFVDAGVNVLSGYSVKHVGKTIEASLSYGKPWIPSKADYWWNSEALDLVGRVWGFFRDEMAVFNPNDMRFEPLSREWSMFAILALYASRKLSFTDDSVPKWYRSKVKKSKLENLLKKHRVKALFKHYTGMKLKKLEAIREHVKKPPCEPLIEVKVVDAVTTDDYPEKISGVLTSPPYIQAQEYIRSFSWELKLMGVPAETVSRLRGLEIPYRKPAPVEIHSEEYYRILEMIGEERFKTIIQSYFTNVSVILEKTAGNLAEEGVMGVFVGDATVRGIPIPIARILKEHLENKLGMKEIIGVNNDLITKRRLFTRRRNLNPNGIKYEHLILLRKG